MCKQQRISLRITVYQLFEIQRAPVAEWRQENSHVGSSFLYVGKQIHVRFESVHTYVRAPSWVCVNWRVDIVR